MGKNKWKKLASSVPLNQLELEADEHLEILPLAHNKPCETIKEITPELVQIIANMKARLEKPFAQKDGMAMGYALAHPQVCEDRPLRLFVAREGKLSGTVFINPEIVWGEVEYPAQESCLSFPTMPPVIVRRYKKCLCRWFDIYGQEHKTEFWDVQAEIFQHEVEHLEGKNIYNWDKKKFVKIAEKQVAKEATAGAKKDD
jgi:peptide deformylase